jgi:hypothetical protein
VLLQSEYSQTFSFPRATSRPPWTTLVEIAKLLLGVRSEDLRVFGRNSSETDSETVSETVTETESETDSEAVSTTGIDSEQTQRQFQNP